MANLQRVRAKATEIQPSPGEPKEEKKSEQEKMPLLVESVYSTKNPDDGKSMILSKVTTIRPPTLKKEPKIPKFEAPIVPSYKSGAYGSSCQTHPSKMTKTYCPTERKFLCEDDDDQHSNMVLAGEIIGWKERHYKISKGESLKKKVENAKKLLKEQYDRLSKMLLKAQNESLDQLNALSPIENSNTSKCSLENDLANHGLINVQFEDMYEIDNHCDEVKECINKIDLEYLSKEKKVDSFADKLTCDDSSRADDIDRMKKLLSIEK